MLAADVVDHQLEEYLKQPSGPQQFYGAQERILVCVTPRSNASLMIQRGRRQADRFHGDLYVRLRRTGHLNVEDQQIIEASLAQAPRGPRLRRNSHGEDPSETSSDFAADTASHRSSSATASSADG